MSGMETGPNGGPHFGPQGAKDPHALGATFAGYELASFARLGGLLDNGSCTPDTGFLIGHSHIFALPPPHSLCMFSENYATLVKRFGNGTGVDPAPVASNNNAIVSAKKYARRSLAPKPILLSEIDPTLQEKD